MTARLGGLGVLLAAVAAGLGFSAVFAPMALLVPCVAVVLPAALVDQLIVRTTRPRWLRLPVGLVGGVSAGALALTLPQAPWGPALQPVLAGVAGGWLRTLESTFPALPDPELLAFVPLLVLLVGVTGLEWLRGGFPPLVALLPSLVLLGGAQLFRAVVGWPVIALTAGYGVAVAMVLAGGRGARGARRVGDLLLLGAPVAVVSVLAAWAVVAVDPVGRPAFSVHDRFELVAVPSGAVSPLTEIGGRLDRPDDVAFTARTDAAVDRWPQLVLDGFDGAGWTSSARYRPLGAALDPDPAVRVPLISQEAEVRLGPAADGPWLPTQFRTTAVDGLRPAVDTATGALLLPDSVHEGDAYTVRWQAAQPAPEQLLGAGVDVGAPGAVALGDIPAGVADAARGVLADAPPSFAAALKLETWMRDTFRLATGDQPPTGSGSAQVLEFLAGSRPGTTEQFATAYVLMARSARIPARLVVGFRQPQRDPGGEYVVHNRDAFAWPEVAVTGVGWVALDPTGGAKEDPQHTPPATKAVDQARQQVEDGTVAVPQQVPAPAPTATERPVDPDAEPWEWLPALLGGLVLALLAGVGGIPAAKLVRRAGRRRAGGGQAVVGAWLETRDRLRDHGVDASAGMTVRDVRAPATAVLNGSSAQLERLAHCLDSALWSGAAPTAAVVDDAWAAERAVREALRRRPPVERVRAALRLRGLRSVRG
jgi:transglutaminase-like putative cysteine protease